jgi:hypothetical protein
MALPINFLHHPLPGTQTKTSVTFGCGYLTYCVNYLPKCIILCLETLPGKSGVCIKGGTPVLSSSTEAFISPKRAQAVTRGESTLLSHL